MDDNNSKNDPKTLIQLAKNGDAEAFGCLYELYFVPVFRYIYLRVKGREEAEDLAQNVFLKVYQSISSFQEQGKSPLAYFFTVARNAVIDHWKKKKSASVDPQAISEMPDPAENPQELTEKDITIKTIHQAIQQLTDDQREVIIMKFINELPNSEIAGLLGKTEDAVRQLQCRALRTLRQQLKDSKII